MKINNKLIAYSNYSTTEQVVGIWIDNRPIYRKIVNFGNLPDNTTKVLNHNISNVDYFTKVEATGYGGTNNSYPIPFVPNSNMFSGGSSTIRANRTQIQISTSYDFSSHTAYVILEYVKTTD